MLCNICKDLGYIYSIKRGYSILTKCGCQADCNICYGTGYVDTIKDGYRFLKKCKCKELDGKIKRYNEIKIPSKYAQKRISNFIFDYEKNTSLAQKAIIRDLKDYLSTFDRNSKGIILDGSNGVGKTHLLTAMLAQLVLTKNLTGLYIDFPQWIAANKFKFGNLQDRINDTVSVDILVIDEFGKTNNRDFDKEKMEEIFYERYNQGKVTFIGTNYYVMRNRGLWLGDVVSPALYSRLGDFNSFKSFTLPGEDYRSNGEILT